jgi:hypothetical protein
VEIKKSIFFQKPPPPPHPSPRDIINDPSLSNVTCCRKTFIVCICSNSNYNQTIIYNVLTLQEGTDVNLASSLDGNKFPHLLAIGGNITTINNLYIIASKQVVCEVPCGQLLDAVLGMVGIFYVFMFNYPPGLTTFYIFLQKCILSINDGRKLPSSIITLINTINGVDEVHLDK